MTDIKGKLSPDSDAELCSRPTCLLGIAMWVLSSPGSEASTQSPASSSCRGGRSWCSRGRRSMVSPQQTGGNVGRQSRCADQVERVRGTHAWWGHGLTMHWSLELSSPLGCGLLDANISPRVTAPGCLAHPRPDKN